MIAREHPHDPIHISLFTTVQSPRRIELRIGGLGQGEGRIAVLTTREAQRLAASLLTMAEKALVEADEDGKTAQKK